MMSTRGRIISTMLVSAVLMMGFSLGAVAQKKVVVWHFGGLPAEHKWVDECIKDFNAAHPEMKVERIEKSWMTKSEELISAWQMKAMPDIISRDSVSIPDMVEMGMLAPLSELFAEDIAAMKGRWLEPAWNLCNYEGAQYGVPTYVDIAPMLAYNRNMFAEAGILVPTNWSQVVEAAKKLYTPEHYGIILPATLGLNDLQVFIGIAYGNGGRFLSPEGDKVVFNGKGFVDALQLYVDLFRKHKVTPPGTLEIDYMKTIELFLRERTAMAVGMSWFPIVVQNLGVPEGFDYRMASFPVKEKITGQYPSAAAIMDATTTYMMISTSKVKKEAWEFMKWVTRPETMRMWAGVRIEGRVPTTHEGFKTPEIAKTYPDLVREYEKGTVFKGAISMPSFPGFTEMTKVFGLSVQGALLGEPVQEALDERAEECQDILEEM